jgi:hypothetical protein
MNNPGTKQHTIRKQNNIVSNNFKINKYINENNFMFTIIMSFFMLLTTEKHAGAGQHKNVFVNKYTRFYQTS